MRAFVLQHKRLIALGAGILAFALTIWLAPVLAAILAVGITLAALVVAIAVFSDRAGAFFGGYYFPQGESEQRLEGRAGIEPAAPRREDASTRIAPVSVGAPESTRHRLFSWPSTRDGRRAVVLALALLGLVLLDRTLAAADSYDESDIWSLGLMMIIGFAIVAGSVAADVRALGAVRRGDRSIALLLPLLPTAAAVMFVVDDVLA